MAQCLDAMERHQRELVASLRGLGISLRVAAVKRARRELQAWCICAAIVASCVTVIAIALLPAA